MGVENIDHDQNMNKRKKIILDAAVSLFNEVGIANTKNQDIAKKAGISLSNYNYHFGTKNDLIYAVFNLMTLVLDDKVYGNKMLAKESQGLFITKSYFEFQQDFSFFYLDTPGILMTYPELNEKVQKQIDESFQVIKNLQYLSIGMGHMKPEPSEFPGLYDLLVRHIMIHNHFWFAHSQIRGEKENLIKKGLESLFSLTYPYLTEKGIEVYKEFINGVE